MSRNPLLRLLAPIRLVLANRNADLCGWSADQMDLVEFGADPCREAWKSLADVLDVYCGATRRSSITARPYRGGAGYVVLWPRD